MASDKESSTSDLGIENPELMTLAELQQFLISELKKVDGDSSPQRALAPLTDGLGLQSPAKFKDDYQPLFQSLSQTAIPKAIPKTRRPDVSELLGFIDEPKPVKILKTEQPEAAIEKKVILKSVPPALPLPTLFQRVQSAVIDQAFVLSCWAVVLVITAQFFVPDDRSLLIHLLSNFSNPVFFRLSLVEYGLVWFFYLAATIAFAEKTFGM